MGEEWEEGEEDEVMTPQQALRFVGVVAVDEELVVVVEGEDEPPLLDRW